MFHIVYKITNKLNGKYYHGVHSTENLDDGYYGSGKLIKQAIKKHGKNCFTKEIVGLFDSRKEALLKEHELANPDDSKSYNMAIGGGGGGFYNKSHTDEFKKLVSNLHKGKVVSEETKSKLRKVVKPKGIPRPKFVKDSISKTVSGEGHPSFISGSVKSVSPDGIETIYSSRYNAAMSIGLKSSSNISKAIKTGGICKGRKWYEL